MASAIGTQLVTALKGDSLDPGLWQLGVFIAEELAQASAEGEQILLPVFLDARDVQAAFDKVGLPPKALEGVKVLELRQLLKAMGEPAPDAVNPWRAVRFMPSHSAVQLRQEVSD